MGEQKPEEIREVVAEENKNASAGREQKFDFITETIKRKPINKKRLLGKFVWNVFLAIVFGVIACTVFIIIRPHMENLIHPQPEEVDLVTIPKEELEAEPETESEVETVPEETEEKPQEVITQVVQKVETVNKELGISDYQHLYHEINAVTKEARKSMVTVTGVFSDVDWFLNPYEENESTSGLIVAENGKELLMIAQTRVIKNAESVRVTFCDGTEQEAVIKRSDSETGLSIVAVEIEKIPEETKAQITMAKLGSSLSPSLVGTPVLAIGNPIGIAESVSQGIITSNSYVKTLSDSSIRFMTTNIIGSIQASGVLFDLDGNVLGIIYQDKSVGDVSNLVKAYGISDLKGKIEKLSNGQDLAYLGINGTDVTDQAAEELGIPKGAYVKEVILDSPAMEAGIQNGDIIVKMGTTDILSFEEFKDTMLKCQPGDLMMVTVKRQGISSYSEYSYEVTLGTMK